MIRYKKYKVGDKDMNVGDRLYCKNVIFDFKYGKWYNIHEVISYGPGIGMVKIIGKGYQVYDFTTEYVDRLYVWRYFYTEKDIRKKKLEVINERS